MGSPRRYTDAMLLGRRTWQPFAKIWPDRVDEFSAKMVPRRTGRRPAWAPNAPRR